MSPRITFPANDGDSQAEGEATAMRATLESLDLERPDLASHLRSEADARRQLAAANDLLTRYLSTYGESSSLPPQTRELSEQIKRKEEELKGLRLQDSQREQGEAPVLWDPMYLPPPQNRFAEEAPNFNGVAGLGFLWASFAGGLVRTTTYLHAKRASESFGTRYRYGRYDSS